MKTLIEPIVEDHDLELVDIIRREGRPPWQVRVVVDRPEADGRVPIEHCARLSREVAVHLDASDLIPVAYDLEVSSPGLDRILAREKDFAAAVGAVVKLETRAPIDGRKRFRGRLAGYADAVASIEVDGTEVAIPFAAISRAHTIYEFTRDDFAGRERSEAASRRGARS